MYSTFEVVAVCRFCGAHQSTIAVDPAALLTFHQSHPTVNDLELHVRPEPGLLIYNPGSDLQEPCPHSVACWVEATFRSILSPAGESSSQLDLTWFPPWLDASGEDKERIRSLEEYAAHFLEFDGGFELESEHEVIERSARSVLKDPSAGEVWHAGIHAVFFVAERPMLFMEGLQKQLAQTREGSVATAAASPARPAEAFALYNPWRAGRRLGR